MRLKYELDVQYGLPSTFPDQTRGSDQHGNQVTKGAEGNQEVETPDGVAGTEDVPEEQAGGDLAGGGEVFLGYWT